MNVYRLKDMKGGWYIGDFSPSVHKTNKFEAAIHTHKANSHHDNHYHKISTEINVLISGRMSVDGGKTELNAGDIFVIFPMEPVYPIFYEDCVISVIKVPSSVGDKYAI